jgi:hypothetical protein
MKEEDALKKARQQHRVKAMDDDKLGYWCCLELSFTGPW